MAFREVTVLEIKEVLRLSRERVAKKRIAAQLGLDIKTVRRYLKLAAGAGVEADGDLDRATTAVVEALSASHGRARGADWELCAQQREFIVSHLRHGVRLTKVRRLLLRREVRVPYTTLYRFAVEELGFGRRPATIPVADCGPGEEVQLDTGWVGWLKVDLFGRRGDFGPGSSRPCARGTASSTRYPRRRRRARSRRARRRGSSSAASSRC